MRTWVLPLISLLTAMAVGYVHLTTPVDAERTENPMLWASDAWSAWDQWRLSDAAIEWGTDEMPESEWIRRFAGEEGRVVWHAESSWPELPEGWSQRAWRGGWLCGTSESLDAWQEAPGEMAKHWREGEQGARLERTSEGWSWRGEGWVVWPDQAQASLDGQVVDHGSWVPSGVNTPHSWWTGTWHGSPTAWGGREVVAALKEAGVPLAEGGTWWNEGGRMRMAHPESWHDVVQEVASTKGWKVHWLDDVLVINGQEDWDWSPSEEVLTAQTDEGRWVGSLVAGGRAVAWVLANGSREATREQESSGQDWLASKTGERELGTVRNHRTQGRMKVLQKDDGVVAEGEDGSVVWGFKSVEPALPGGAQEVDVYANGKYQTMIGFPSGLHLVDVKGREVQGFPIQASEGSWTAWALVDYEGTRKYRYLVASEVTGLVENFRGEGARTPGWRHRPAEGIDVSSPVRHLAHLRLGSRDYLYVGRDNGQVELLKRDGTTRSTTPVRVDAHQPPVFRIGANLDRTSVLFLDATGWVREFTLGQGEEVGLSGATRADRLETVDVDGDGRDEIVTWHRGERSVWNARNERVN